MSIEKPAQGVGKKEPISLDSAARHLLEECRMVLPGIQALFGFQLIAVFNEGFSKKLSPAEQELHLAAIVLVAVAVALVMAPAAIHRQTQQREVSERFIWISSRLLLASMFPLAVALCLDIYLISRVILERGAFSAAIAAILLAVIFILWILLPASERAKHR
jgi:small-conductance mechanosensitive channel